MKRILAISIAAIAATSGCASVERITAPRMGDNPILEVQLGGLKLWLPTLDRRLVPQDQPVVVPEVD